MRDARHRVPLVVRFWSKVIKQGDDECWMWAGSRSPQGYGQIRLPGRKGKLVAAHRVVYEMEVGPIPEGHDMDHLCENKACVNPKHLEPVTRQDNMLRFHGKRTACKFGHPLDGFVHSKMPNGTPTTNRYCRTCARERNRAARRTVGLEQR
jgi:HNH endonuclease